MSGITLSICIPTYNRAAYLRKLLTHVRDDLKFEFPYEIVIVDNASTDNTHEVVEEFADQGFPIRCYKRKVNAGWPAGACGYLQAKGRYAMYLADDDLLVHDGIVAAIRYLDANPDVTACYAPWFMHDEVARRDTGQFYQIDSDTKFPRQSFAELFAFIYERHIFPEIGIGAPTSPTWSRSGA
jgi:glycosyltransferase involved in cell wall biosynthesis